MKAPSVLWFRQDLRLADNPALKSCLAGDGPVIPVYVWAPGEEGGWPPGAASRAWLHHSLKRLADRIEAHGSRLLFLTGPAHEALAAIASATGARAVHCGRRHEPAAREQERRVAEALQARGAVLQVHNTALLFDPEEALTGAGAPYRVFTPYWKRCMSAPEPSPPEPLPARLPGPDSWPDALSLEQLGLLGDAHQGCLAHWAPGEEGAASALETFLDEGLADYAERRDIPSVRGTSCLSPHLHFGEIGPRQIWHAVQDRMLAEGAACERGAAAFLRELGWREFSYSLLNHFPETPETPLVPKFAAFPWRDDPEALRRWREGRTGYPIVDAGMRELLETGWMHNRVRMIAASFLVKDLLLPWQEGARWFWERLVDADLANNTQGWQWTAGCGADAAPYFRVFNPSLQAKRYDPDGAYVRRWAPDAGSAGYPPPMVDHAAARDRALEAFGVL